MLKLAIRGVRHNTGRYVATLIAIITGVAFFAATGFLSDRVVESLEGDTNRQFGNVDLAIVVAQASGPVSDLQLRIPSEVANEVFAAEGVEGFAGVLTGEVAFIDRAGEVTAEGAVGRLWVEDEELNPIDVTEGRAPVAAGEIAIDAGTATDQALGVGDNVTLLSLAGSGEATVVGITKFGDSDAVDGGGTISVPASVAFDVLADGVVEYEEIHLRGDGGLLAQEELAEAVSPVLPPGFEARLGDDFLEEKRSEIGEIGTFLKRGLQAFAYIALFVGAFVIYNTFSVIVAQRTRELAVMRAIGATPKQVRRALRFEGLVIGLLGSALGVIAGIGFTYLLDLVLGWFDVALPGSGIAFRAGTVRNAIFLGTIITFVSVMIPARRAAKTEPIEALRDAAVESSPFSRARMVFVGLVGGLGLVGLLFGNKAWMVGAGLGATLIALIAAGPVFAVLASKLAKPVLARLGLEGRLAADNSGRNPLRTATTANALLIGVFLVTLVSVAGTSVKDFVLEEIRKVESADYLIASTGGTLDDQLIDDLSAVDGVERIEAFRRESVAIDGTPSLVSTADVEALVEISDLEAIDGDLADLTAGTIAISEILDEKALGDTVTLSDATGQAIDLRIVARVAVTVDGEQVGSLIAQDDFDVIVGDTAPTVAFIDVASGVQVETQEALVARTEQRPDLELHDGNLLGQFIANAFDFMINAVNGLLGMSVLVAVIGIINTLSLSIYERRRELGLLRVVGMVDKKVQRMVRLESILISTLGTVLGIAAGLFSAWVLLRALRRMSDADIALSFAFGRLGIVLAAGVALGFLAALIPANRSTRLDVLEAIQST